MSNVTSLDSKRPDGKPSEVSADDAVEQMLSAIEHVAKHYRPAVDVSEHHYDDAELIPDRGITDALAAIRAAAFDGGTVTASVYAPYLDADGREMAGRLDDEEMTSEQCLAALALAAAQIAAIRAEGEAILARGIALIYKLERAS